MGISLNTTGIMNEWMIITSACCAAARSQAYRVAFLATSEKSVAAMRSGMAYVFMKGIKNMPMGTIMPIKHQIPSEKFPQRAQRYAHIWCFKFAKARLMTIVEVHLV